ncbi:MAG: hypothetical protein ACREJC_11245 [Tepidisphaeraceae bacterium]
MKTIFRFIVFILLVAGWGLAALALHVVRTPHHLAVIPKSRLGIDDTYVDATKWTLRDVSDHPVVVMRIIQIGKSSILEYVIDQNGGDVESQLEQAISRPAETSRPSGRSNRSGAQNATRTARAGRNWWEMGG